MNSSYCMYWKSIWCNANGEAVIQPSWWHVIAAFAQNKGKNLPKKKKKKFKAVLINVLATWK